jgi:hypothetical protein
MTEVISERSELIADCHLASPTSNPHGGVIGGVIKFH